MGGGANSGSGVLGMVISEADPTQLSFCLAYMGRQISLSLYSFAMFKKNLLADFSSKNQGAKIIPC